MIRFYLPADTGTAVINPRVMKRSYVSATLKLPNIFATAKNNIKSMLYNYTSLYVLHLVTQHALFEKPSDHVSIFSNVVWTHVLAD